MLSPTFLKLATENDMIQEGHKAIREHPEEGYRDGEGPGGEEVAGTAEHPWFVQSKAEEAEGRPHGGPQLLKAAAVPQRGAALISALW